ncbi:helix-turn-helix domain-containing protein [Microbacterium sp. zg.B48]|uniref:PucR family transcriptional regulator n=1 Tax=Microbacterium sp. zg.B48 TaxID=2969408 RepID=UPI00214B0FE1|nr:helix-turn-helix domain-containing protein [Microbacterium sp. zg.B48]MCR2764483.1 helix-turn-helix domain-containing protein [Microbacterium sp. zg.B48]
MVNRIDEVFTHVPEVERPPTLNDARTIATLSEGMEPRLVSWALHVARAAAEEASADVAPARFEILAEMIGMAIESISINLIRYLLTGRDNAAGVRVSKAQRTSTLTSVHVGIPLERLIGGMRTLDHRWRRTFIEIVVQSMPRQHTVALLTDIDRSLATYFGALIDQNAGIYTDEHERLRDQRVVGQRQLLERLISGVHIDDEIIADVFGVPPASEHVCVVVSPASHSEARAVQLDFAGFRQSVARRFADRTVNSVPVDQDTVWILITGAALREEPVAEWLERVVTEMPGSLVSIGLVGSGTSGLRTSCLTATAAHALNRLSPKAGPVVSFAADGILALAAQSPELARLFVQSEIGPLLGTGPLIDDLHRTLSTLIGLNGSLVRAAEVLYVHRNTIAYRLKRIEEILGRDPMARPVETQTALLLADYLSL